MNSEIADEQNAVFVYRWLLLVVTSTTLLFWFQSLPISLTDPIAQSLLAKYSEKKHASEQVLYSRAQDKFYFCILPDSVNCKACNVNYKPCNVNSKPCNVNCKVVNHVVLTKPCSMNCKPCNVNYKLGSVNCKLCCKPFGNNCNPGSVNYRYNYKLCSFNSKPDSVNCKPCCKPCSANQIIQY